MHEKTYIDNLFEKGDIEGLREEKKRIERIIFEIKEDMIYLLKSNSNENKSLLEKSRNILEYETENLIKINKYLTNLYNQQ